MENLNEQDRNAVKRVWVYVWLLPAVWCVLCFFGFEYHGDEYGVWAIESLPAVLIWVWIHGNSGDTLGFLFPVLSIGACLMATVGFLMDRSRVRIPLFALVFFVAAVIIGTVLLSIEPGRPIWTSEQRVPTYSIFALMMGLYTAILISTFGTIGVYIYRSVLKRSRAGVGPVVDHG